MNRINKLILNLVAISFVLLFWQLEPPPSDVIIAAVVVLWLITVILRKNSFRLDVEDWVIAAFGVFNLIQLVTNHDRQSIFWVAITTFLILGYFLIKNISQFENNIRVIWKTYVISAVLSASIMFTAFISFYSYQINTLAFMEYGRARGLFKDPNVAGPFLIPALLYLIWRFVHAPSILKLVAVNLLYISIFFALSRGGIINLVIASVLMLVFLWRDFWIKKKNFFIISMSMVISSAFIFFYPPFYNLAKERFVFLQYYDTQGRVGAWQTGAGQVQIFGSGPGSFEGKSSEAQLKEAERRVTESTSLSLVEKENIIRRLKEASTSAEAASSVGVTITPSAHNTYLRVLKENGILGITIFLGFFGLILYKFIKSYKINPNTLTIIIFVSLVGLLVNAFTIDALHWRLTWYLPALLLASMELKRAKD